MPRNGKDEAGADLEAAVVQAQKEEQENRYAVDRNRRGRDVKACLDSGQNREFAMEIRSGGECERRPENRVPDHG